MAATCTAHGYVLHEVLYPYPPHSGYVYDLETGQICQVAEPANAAQDLQFFDDCEGPCHRKDRLEMHVLNIG